jgi:biopolymer transport protein ExbB
MKRIIAFFALVTLITVGFANRSYAVSTADISAGAVIEAAAIQDNPASSTPASENEPQGFHQVLKEFFIKGGAGFMAAILLVLIFGLAIAIERILYLNLASTNNQKLLNKIESALESKGIDAAMEVCKNTRGPVASIFYQGLSRYEEGLEIVEKSIVSYGSVLMGRLESGLSWISLFIALGPMLGFLGTVIGLVLAFEAIETAGDISPSIVASGMKIALITTVFGLIVAIILQIFYNYLIVKIDNLVNGMEDSTISFIDILAKYKK